MTCAKCKTSSLNFMRFNVLYGAPVNTHRTLFTINMAAVKQNIKKEKKKNKLKKQLKLLSCHSAVHQVPFEQHKQTTCISYYKR